MSLEKSKQKDPADIRDYSFDWTDFLGDDTIATSEFTVPTGIARVGSGGGIVAGAKQTTIRLSGGTHKANYTIANKITLTTSTETFEKSGVIAVREQ